MASPRETRDSTVFFDQDGDGDNDVCFNRSLNPNAANMPMPPGWNGGSAETSMIRTLESHNPFNGGPNVHSPWMPTSVEFSTMTGAGEYDDEAMSSTTNPY